MSPKSRFLPSAPKTINFIFLEPPQSQPFDFSEEAVGRLVPKPTQEYICANGSKIWFWDNSALDATVRSKLITIK
jgi:hypothetical protein